MPGPRLRRRQPFAAAATCAAFVLLAVLCIILTTRLARCNAAQPETFSKVSVSRMEQQHRQRGTDRRRPRLAVLIPFRDRPQQLAAMLPITAGCLARSGVDASIFVLEQAPGLHFNRGALLNAGALLLAGSSYDCLVFHDVDTICGSRETVGDLMLCGILLLHCSVCR